MHVLNTITNYCYLCYSSLFKKMKQLPLFVAKSRLQISILSETDKDAVNHLLSTRSMAQRLDMAHAYKVRYDKVG